MSDFSEFDKGCMREALRVATKGLPDNYPIAAVLSIDDQIIGSQGNTLIKNKNWTDHAESQLITEYGTEIKLASKTGRKVAIYTTLEPCLRCLGAISMSRVSHVIYSCPDPYGGSTELDNMQMKPFYHSHWPIIKGGLFAEDSWRMLIDFMRSQKGFGPTMLNLFEGLEGTL